MLAAIKTRIVAAMKSGNTLERNILKVVLGDLQSNETRKGAALTAEECELTVRKIIKGVSETIAVTADPAAKATLEAEKTIMESLLPKTASADEIAAALAPVADAVRSILDGHVVLSRDLASRHHYPPIDVLQSVSRTMPDVTEVAHRRKAGQVREWMAAIRDSEDLVSVGAYVAGSNPRIDEARGKRDRIGAFLCQDAGSLCSLTDAVAALEAL